MTCCGDANPLFAITVSSLIALFAASWLSFHVRLSRVAGAIAGQLWNSNCSCKWALICILTRKPLGYCVLASSTKLPYSALNVSDSVRCMDGKPNHSNKWVFRGNFTEACESYHLLLHYYRSLESPLSSTEPTHGNTEHRGVPR